MMYLSKLTLNPRLKQVRQDIANPYDMHATLCWAFRKTGIGEVPPCERSKTVDPFLWRLEQGPSEATLLVQSLSPPNWQALFERHPGYAELDEKSPKPFEPALRRGQLLRFRLRANPTVTKFDPEKGKGKRHGLVKLEEQLAWLHRQGERHGFEVPGAMVSSAERIQARKRQNDAGRVMTLQSVTYNGHLRVNNPVAFLTALRSGLGHAKSLGFGLLSVAKG